MRLVSRAADSVAEHYNAIAEVDGAKHGREDADVGLRSRDDECIDASAYEGLVEVCARPRGRPSCSSRVPDLGLRWIGNKL